MFFEKEESEQEKSMTIKNIISLFLPYGSAAKLNCNDSACKNEKNS